MIQILQGDCRDVLATLEAGSVQMCVTSPPYFGLRSYNGGAAEIGLEATPDAYIAALVEVFRGVRRVLRDDGTLWVNIGDSYATNPGNGRGGEQNDGGVPHRSVRDKTGMGLKTKDLIGIPWMLAFALRADGWYLRSDIIWSKPNVMPESVRDRPTKSHEYLFLLSKHERYFYDAAAIQEQSVYRGPPKPGKQAQAARTGLSPHRGHLGTEHPNGRNKRSVWTVATMPYKQAHYATFPEKLIEPCILAGSRPGDIVLDPFGGSGTTARVAAKHQRDAILIELNPSYIEQAEVRTDGVQTTMLV